MLPLTLLLAVKLTVLLVKGADTVMLGVVLPTAESVKVNASPCDRRSDTAVLSVIFTTPPAVACTELAVVVIGNAGPMLPPPGVVAVINVRLGVTIVTDWSAGTMLPLPAPVRLTDAVPLTFAASVMPPL